MKGTGAKRNDCPGSCVSTGAKFPVAPVESAPMPLIYGDASFVEVFFCGDATITADYAITTTMTINFNV